MAKLNYSKIYKKWYILFIFAIILTIFVHLLGNSGFFQETELKILDYRFRQAPIPEKANPDVVMIVLDDSSLDFFQSHGISWPWPRSFYAFALDFFYKAKSKAVIFDVLFYESDLEREETSAEETDTQFANAMRKCSNVFLGSQLRTDSLSIPEQLEKSAVKLEGEFSFARTYPGLRFPIKPFLQSALAIGLVDAFPDADGVIRRVYTLNKVGDHILPQMALQAWLRQAIEKDSIYVKQNQLIVGSERIPIDKKGNYLINWYGKKEDIEPFEAYPFRTIINSASALAQGIEPVIAPEFFEDKYIIIGATAAGLFDLKTSPWDPVLPGMQIWATVLSNYLNSDFISIIPAWLILIITFLMIYVVFFTVSNLSAIKANLISILFFSSFLTINYILWKEYRILLNLIIPTIGFILSYMIINTVSYLLEGRSRRQIRKLFSRYLDEGVIKQLEEEPEQLSLGGTEIDASVLYTDIYDFTTISETKKPFELVADLNQYLERLVDCIFQHKGLLDKYTGDGIMALFGTPVTTPDHALLACLAANEHRKYREMLRRKTGLSLVEKFHFGTRIGINSGLLVAGNIGSYRRMDYTAIGDTVNLAARLEGVNKIYFTNIIISEITYKLVQNDFICRELDSLKVKGRTQPTRIYELIGHKEDFGNIPDFIDMYVSALEEYRNGNWKDAELQFKKLTEKPYSDKASQVLLDRCKYLKKNPPREWDGVLKLEVK